MTTDREPESWQTNAAGPCITIGEVEIWVLGKGRFRIVAPTGEHEIEGFDEARQLAHELAASEAI